MRAFTLRRVTSTALLSIFAAGFLSASAIAQSCAEGTTISQFDEKSSPVDGFTRQQVQRGEINFANDPKLPSNRVVKFTAQGKRGKEVGKADLIYAFPERKAGTLISMDSKVYFPPGSMMDSIIIMDLECASCGVDTNPGIRLYFRSGLLRVDRSKIGIKDPMLPTVNRRVTTGEWHFLTWEVTLGIGNAGRSVIYLDGEKIMDVSGTTILTQAAVDKIAKIRVREQVDRFQVGLTANSNDVEQVMYIDDVAICFN